MLHILIGRAGNGKSTKILEHIKKRGLERKQILLVPEQSSYETECRLCEVNGNESSRYAEVFSFTNLQKRIAILGGEADGKVLDDGGRILMMYTALKKVTGSLSTFSASAQKPEMLTQLIATINELKGYCVSPEELSEVAEYGEGMSAQKVRDLSLIYAVYDQMTTQGAMDPKDQLTRMTELVEQDVEVRSFVSGNDYYIDGFMHFTPQEERAIEALLKASNSVTVALTCDTISEMEQAEEIFDFTRKTAHKMMQIAQKNNIPIAIELAEQTRQNGALSHLEKQLFSDTASVYEKDSYHQIQVVQAEDRRQEVAWVAGKVRELLQRGQVRYRDITITARDMTPYRDLLESAFARHEIPLFQSTMNPILQKPIFTLVTSVIDIIAGNYAYEDVFRYLKTGLTNVTIEECDEIENYVLLWNIRGSQWKEFNKHPRGYEKTTTEKDVEQLELLNQIRKKVVKPFQAFEEKMKQSNKNIAFILYEFMEEIDLPSKLEDRAKGLLEQGEPELAIEYRQLWDIFCEALEQYVAILGDTPIGFEDCAKLFKLLFSQYEVGSIPASLDRVIAGDMPRLLNRTMKTLFILGAEEGSIPQVMPATGLFNQEDRAFLLDNDIELSHNVEDKMKQEFMILYEACTQPSEQLFMSYPLMAEGECEPSFLARNLLDIFPQSASEANNSIENDPIRLKMRVFEDDALRLKMEQSQEYALLFERLQHVGQWNRGELSALAVESLYGKRISASPSSLEKYRNCRFAYFMQYGLRAKERKVAGFDAPEYGTFMHYVLEFVLQKGKEKGDIKTLSSEKVSEIAHEAIQCYITEYLGGLEWQTPRFRYLFLRLEEIVLVVVQNVLEELQKSQFQPLFFELAFGEGKQLPPISIQSGEMLLSLTGTVDRVDVWEHEDKTYLKVVDYKTGRQDFRLSDVWNGLGLQMLLYLFALEDQADALGADTLVPAGVLYLPAKQIIATGSRDMSVEDRQKQVDKELRRKGIVLEDRAIIEAMEELEGKDYRFLPVKYSKRAEAFTGEGLVSTDNLQTLKERIKDILDEFCQGLQEGDVRANPIWKKETSNSCMYCAYKSACHFEDKLRNEEIEWLAEYSNREFWAWQELQEMKKECDTNGNEENERSTSGH